MREVIGVNHVKAFVFDDTVIMTGANLSNTYFSTRLDRYMVFNDSPELADFVNRFMTQVLSDASFHVNADGSVSTMPPCGVHPVRQPVSFNRALSRSLLTHFQPQNPAALAKSQEGFAQNSELRTALADINATRDMQSSFGPLRQRQQPGHDTDKYRGGGDVVDMDSPGRMVCGAVDTDRPAQTVSRVASEDVSSIPAGIHDTLVFPTVQAAVAGVMQDELATLAVLSSLDAGDCLHMSSAYLNLVPQYERELMEAAGVSPTTFIENQCFCFSQYFF